MAKGQYKRTKYIVLVKFQLKYIVYILLFLYVGAFVAGYTVYWTTWVTLGEKLANVYPMGRLVYIFQAANRTLLWRVLLITPIFVVIGTLLSHRIAGPIYRMGKYIDTLMQGDYSQDIHLRKRDEMKDLAAKLGELCRKLREDKKIKDERVSGLIDLIEKKGASQEIVSEIKDKLSGI